VAPPGQASDDQQTAGKKKAGGGDELIRMLMQPTPPNLTHAGWGARVDEELLARLGYKVEGTVSTPPVPSTSLAARRLQGASSLAGQGNSADNVSPYSPGWTDAVAGLVPDPTGGTICKDNAANPMTCKSPIKCNDPLASNGGKAAVCTYDCLTLSKHYFPLDNPAGINCYISSATTGWPGVSRCTRALDSVQLY
jgi:hypothetical protein